jgi:thioesterase domain-containing protein
MEEQNSFKDNAIDDFSLIPDLVLAASKLNSNNRKINELIEKINQLDTASQLEYIATNINNLPNDIDKTQKELFLKVFKINSQAMCKYQPKIYPGKIVFFRASEGILSEMFDFSSVWSKISSQPIECYSVPGDHQTMLISPNVEVLVKYLNPILQYKIE